MTIEPTQIQETIEGIPLVSPSSYSADRQYFQKGVLIQAVPNAQNFVDLEITDDMVNGAGWCVFWGGEFNADDKIEPGDYGEMSIIDKNDVLGYHTALGLPLGTPIELAKFVYTRYLLKNMSSVIAPGQSFLLVKGLFLRAQVVTTSAGVNRFVSVVYYFAR